MFFIFLNFPPFFKPILTDGFPLKSDYYYYYYYHYFILESFSHQCLLVIFHWILSDSKFPQDSKNLLRLQADLNIVVVYIVSILPLIFTSPSFFSKHLEIVPTASTIRITVTFRFYSIFISPERSN